MKQKRRNIIFGISLLLWLTGIGVGTHFIKDYVSTAGYAGAIPQTWPADSQMKLLNNKYTLVLFLHPECPCSKASVNELERMIKYIHEDAQVYAVFVRPNGWTDERTKGSLWNRTISIPGVIGIIDSEDGVELSNFGTYTSGHILAYDSKGQLRFNGGITKGRGHEGENLGADSLKKLISSGSTKVSKTKVFGCSLISNTESVKKGVAYEANSNR